MDSDTQRIGHITATLELDTKDVRVIGRAGVRLAVEVPYTWRVRRWSQPPRLRFLYFGVYRHGGQTKTRQFSSRRSAINWLECYQLFDGGKQ